MICLTEGTETANYSHPIGTTHSVDKSMSNKCKDAETPVVFLKDESARQRWELFHRAIAHAKQSTVTAMDDDHEPGEPEGGGPILSVVR